METGDGAGSQTRPRPTLLLRTPEITARSFLSATRADGSMPMRWRWLGISTHPSAVGNARRRLSHNNGASDGLDSGTFHAEHRAVRWKYSTRGRVANAVPVI